MNIAEEKVTGHEWGQVLVVVALAMFVLIGFVALAVDVGHWYGQRRHMQNAADAGALAGAYELCFGSRDNVHSTALDYAVRNGADTTAMGSDDIRITMADGTVDETNGDTVIVTARTNADTFFARVLGLDQVAVSAEAAAGCRSAGSGCGMWPVAFDLVSYRQIMTATAHYDSNWNLTRVDRVAGSQFVLWAGDNVDLDADAMLEVKEHCLPPAEAQEGMFVPFVGGSPMESGNRGWVDLALANPYKPPSTDPYSDCSGTLDDCGSASLKCWLSHGFIGSLSLEDCVKGEAGTDTSGLKAAEAKEGQPVTMLLFGPESCPDPNDIAGNCSSSGSTRSYYITGFGCVLVDVVYTNTGSTHTHPDGYTHPTTLTFEHRQDDDGTHESNPDSSAHNNKYCVWDEKKGEWDCKADKYVCPTGADILVTKLDQCPPTLCTGPESGSNSAMKAVALVEVPHP